MKTDNQETLIVKIDNLADRDRAFAIRNEVFVVEQKVSTEEEFDEFENISVHFLALHNNRPAGAARWRWTPEGAKLERFCVLKEFRYKGIASELITKVIEDVIDTVGSKPMYLHAQVDVIPLYKTFGFKEVGETFDECGILHKTMIRK